MMDVPYQSAYPSITGAIFEFGFSDSILQMWAAFCDGSHPECWLSRICRAMGIKLQNRRVEDSPLERIGIKGLSHILPLSTQSAEEPECCVRKRRGEKNLLSDT